MWTLIAMFSAIMFAALGLSTRYTVSTLRAEIRAVDVKHDGRFDLLHAEILGVEHRLSTRIDEVGTRIDGLDTRTDTLRSDLIERVDARFDHFSEVFGVRFASVDHRLEGVEQDLRIVKAHLLRHPAA